MSAIITTSRILENSAVLLLARLVDVTGSPIVQAGVSTIHLKVFDMSDGSLVIPCVVGAEYGDTSIDKTDAIYNTLQTNATLWPIDDTGFNFSYELDGCYFPNGDAKYQVEIKITPASGPYFYVVYRLPTTAIYSE